MRTTPRHLGYPAAAVVFAIGMAGTTLPTPLYGLYREELGFSEFIVTVVYAVYAVGVIAVLLLAGNYSDTVGRKPVLLIAVGLSAASALCFLFEGGLGLLFVGRLLSGFSAGLFSGAATATVLDLASPAHKARAGLAATAANMGGLGCGPLLAGLLAEYATHPLRLPFLVHLVLLAVATCLTLLLPESVERRASVRDGEAGRVRRWPRPTPQGLVVPPEVRGVFGPAALAAFAGFALLGLFSSVAPSFATQTLHEDNLAVVGAVVFSTFLASTVGQLAMGWVGGRRALPLGSFVLVGGLALVAASLAAESLGLLVAGAVTAGLGQGLAFRSAVTSIGATAPPAQRAGTISAFFVIAYIGISLPVIGVGALSLVLDLRTVGLIFTACVAVLAAWVGLHTARRDAGGTGGPGTQSPDGRGPSE
ncbi:MFS transporter [Streptomyces sp. NPDC088261]|uniref:MFS transporter n=1 Tax=Streptomyces sp. NPDC088261 TaxID=3365851 RepID=UPI003803E2E1